MVHHIAIIGGDGIGPEVTREALKVVRATGVAFDATEFDLGGGRYLKDGEILSDATLADLRTYDTILLGAVGLPGVPDHVSLWGLLIPIRRSFDQYVNMRPVRLAPCAPGASPTTSTRAPGSPKPGTGLPQ